MTTLKLFAILSAFCVTSTLSCGKRSSQAPSGNSASGNSTPAESPGTTIDDRPRLYPAISSPYFLDGKSCNPLRTGQFITFYGGMKKLADSKDPFVSKLAQTTNEERKAHDAMYDEAFAIRQGGDLNVAKIVRGRIQKDIEETFGTFVNSGFMVRNLLADSMNIETDAQTQDDLMGAYEQILADAKTHLRGAPIDANSFAVDFVDRMPGHVHVTVRSGSGHSLHNALVIAVAKHDPSKINKRYSDDQLLQVFGNPGPEYQKAHDAVNEAYAHFFNTDRGFEIFIPEWKSGQTLEAALCDAYEVIQNQLKPGEVSVFSDESSAVAIPLQTEKMAAAVKQPAPPNPAEKTVDEQWGDDIITQANSLQVTKGDGVITYRYLIYPFWSQGVTKIAAPPDMKYVNIVWDTGVELKMSVNGWIINPEPFAKALVDGHIINDAAKINCAPGSVLAFQTTSTNDPVAIAIRFLQREPTAAEKGNVDLKAAPAANKLESDRGSQAVR